MPSKKVLETKQKFVAELAADFKDAQSIVFADYLGLTVEQDTQMRAAMRKADVEYQVVKNTLSSLALKEAGYTGLDVFLKGPTAIAYSKQDMISPAKTIKTFADKFDKFEIKGGLLEGKAISADQVKSLAQIPGRDVLYGQLVFTLVSPIASLVIVLNAIREKQEAGTEGMADPAAMADAEITADAASKAPAEAAPETPAAEVTAEAIAEAPAAEVPAEAAPEAPAAEVPAEAAPEA